MGHPKRKEKKKKAVARSLPPAELGARILQALRAKRPRLALDHLKDARTAQAKLAYADVLRHCAYLLRVKQLQRQGLLKEAAAMQGLADSSRPSSATLQELPPDVFLVW